MEGWLGTKHLLAVRVAHSGVEVPEVVPRPLFKPYPSLIVYSYF